MLKKSLIFGSVVLFVAALITLTGCPTSVDDDSSSGTQYAHRIYGFQVDPYQAQEAIDNAVAAGQYVVLEDGLDIRAGELNFKGAEVRINGRVTFNGGVMNMTDATVSWAEGAGITMTGGFYICREGTDFGGAEFRDRVDGYEAWFAESLERIRPSSRRAAVREFTLGTRQNYDYSRDSSGVDAKVSAPNLERLFVLDKLTIPTIAASPDVLTLVALGEVDVTGTIINPDVIIGDNDALALGSCSTLTSSRGATIAVPRNHPDPFFDKTLIPNIRVGEGGITLSQVGGSAPLIIRGKLTGPGTLEVTPTNITVYGGDGNLLVIGNGSRQLDILSTGRVTFTGDLTIPPNNNIASVIYSDVVFGGDVVINSPLGLYGNVTLPNHGQTIDFTQPVTLGAGKTITLQVTPQKTTQSIPAPLLTAAGGPVVLTPGGTSTFTTAGAPTTDAAKIAAAKRINLSGGPLEITDGTLQVVPEAIFGNEAALRTKTGDPNEVGYLAVADGGALALTSASVAIGNPVLGGGTSFSFTASGGTITLGNHQITGSAPGTKLTLPRGTNGTINVAGAGALILNKVELDLATAGTITLAGGSTVELDDGAKITLTAGENGQPTTWGYITTTGGGYARLTGAFTGLTPDPTDDDQPAWSVAHRGGALPAVDIIALSPIILGRTPKAEFSAR
ncbi:hypothetical protein LQZ21_11815 [Treponema sp. TIM-1]|uniref:hypothetical protein n=1 Tax=Treponema sp. TIM-1 TaxID=2898417 RepID=UPI00397F70B6